MPRDAAAISADGATGRLAEFRLSRAEDYGPSQAADLVGSWLGHAPTWTKHHPFDDKPIGGT